MMTYLYQEEEILVIRTVESMGHVPITRNRTLLFFLQESNSAGVLLSAPIFCNQSVTLNGTSSFNELKLLFKNVRTFMYKSCRFGTLHEKISAATYYGLSFAEFRHHANRFLM
jgi:hypothetical protein